MCFLAFKNREQSKSLVTPKCIHFPFPVWLFSGEIRSSADGRVCLSCITDSIHFLASSWVEGVFVSMEMREASKGERNGRSRKEMTTESLQAFRSGRGKLEVNR